MKVRTIRRYLSILMCLLMIVSQGVSCFAEASEASETAEMSTTSEATSEAVATTEASEPVLISALEPVGGSCGSNAEWSLDLSTGQLTISGRGQVEDYGTASMAPWFAYRSDIKSVSVGADISGITAADFIGCSSIEAIEADADSSYYKTEDGVLFSKDGRRLITYPEGKSATRYRVPAGVQRIDAMAFELCTGLEYISLPSGVTSVGKDAFANCTSLKKINLPDSLTTMETGAFYGCDSLDTIHIGSGLKSLPEDTFRQCTGLKNVILPDTMSVIGRQAFAGGAGLRMVIIPAGVSKIEDGAFEACDYLADVYYGGSQAQWEKISKGGGNEALDCAAVHCGAKLPDSVYEYMFDDLDSDSWYYESSVFALDNNIMLGTDERTFSPDLRLTRAQMVQILYNFEGQPEVKSGAGAFSDVEAGSWYQTAVSWAYSEGLVNGTSATSFSPDVTLTREQMVTILYRLSEKKGYDTETRAALAGIADAGTVSSWAAESMEWAVGIGMISGYADGRLHPADTATRAQVAAVMKNYISKMEAADDSLPAGSYEKTADSLLMHPVMSLLKGIEYSTDEWTTAGKTGKAGSVTWSSSDTSVVKADQAGMLQAVGQGLSVIKAEGADVQSVGLAVVRDVNVKSIKLDEKLLINCGESKAAGILVVPSYGISMVEWSSSDPEIATVDESGHVTGNKPGTATITARCGGASAVCVAMVGYEDIDNGSELFEGAVWAAEAGIIPCTSDSIFGKNEQVTRGQMALYLWRLNGSPVAYSGALSTSMPGDGVNASYIDAGYESEYNQAVNYVISNGLAEPDSDTMYGTSRPCTKGEAIEMLWNCQKQRVSYWGDTAGVPASSSYYYPVRWALAKGIASGVISSSSSMGESIGKAEAAALLYRAFSIGEAYPDSSRWQVVYPKAELVLDQVGHDIKAAYNWSAAMTYYGHNPYMPDTAEPGIEWYADYGFDNIKGNCYVMAATFYEMAVNLGYSPEQMSGQVPLRRGGLGPHSWVTMDLDGANYVFDPDFEHESKKNGFKISYGQSGTWKYQEYTPMGLKGTGEYA